MRVSDPSSIDPIKAFAQTWIRLYAAERFEEMKNLATEDVGIANAPESQHAASHWNTRRGVPPATST